MNGGRSILGELGHQRREAPLERLGRPRRVPAAHPGRGEVGAPGAVKEPVARRRHRLGCDPQHARQPGAQLVGPPVEPQPAVLRPAPRRRVPLRRLVLAPSQPPAAAEQHDALARMHTPQEVRAERPGRPPPDHGKVASRQRSVGGSGGTGVVDGGAGILLQGARLSPLGRHFTLARDPVAHLRVVLVPLVLARGRGELGTHCGG